MIIVRFEVTADSAGGVSCNAFVDGTNPTHREKYIAEVIGVSIATGLQWLNRQPGNHAGGGAAACVGVSEEVKISLEKAGIRIGP